MAEEKRKRGRGPITPDINYWDGAGQSIGYYANTEQMSHPPGVHVPSVNYVESTPGNIINRIPTVYFLADYLKLHEAGLFVSFRHVGDDPTSEFDPATGGEYYSVLPGTDVTVTYNGRAIVTRSVRSAQGRIGSIDMNEQFEMWLAFFTNNWQQGENLKAMFEHSATDGPIDRNAGELLADTTQRVEETLRSFRGEVYTTARESLAGSSAGLVRAVTGARVLWDSFVSLGLPGAIANDDGLRALLRGTLSIYDEAAIKGWYDTANPHQVSPNPRISMLAEAKRRFETLAGVLKRYLELTPGQPELTRHQFLTGTLHELRLAQVIRGAFQEGESRRCGLLAPEINRATDEIADFRGALDHYRGIGDLSMVQSLVSGVREQWAGIQDRLRLGSMLGCANLPTGPAPPPDEPSACSDLRLQAENLYFEIQRLESSLMGATPEERPAIEATIAARRTESNLLLEQLQRGSCLTA